MSSATGATGAGVAPSDLRRLNEQVVLSAMTGGRHWRATELMGATGLTRVTVMDVLRQLEAREWLVSETAETGERGRPAKTFRRRSPDGFVLGVELGAHDVTVSAADLGGAVRHRTHAVVAADLPRDERLDAALALINDCLSACEADREDVWLVQVGTTGTIADDGSIIRATAISDWAGFDLRQRLAEALQLPVEVGNDIQLLGADQQQWGAAAGADQALVLWLGRRPSASLVLNGSLYTGAHGTAGDLSRVGLLPEDASWNGDGSWLPQLELTRHDGADGFRAALDAARRGDPAALRAFTQWLEKLAPVVSLFAAVVDPEVIVVAGPLAELADVVTPLLDGDLERHLQNRPRLVLSSGGQSSIADASARHAVRRVHDRLILGEGRGVAPLRRESYLQLRAS